MMRDIHNIDKLFNKAIEEHSEQPSENVWSTINKGLDSNKVVSIEKKYFILKRVAVALFILGFASGVFALYSRYRNDNKTNSDTVTVKATPERQNSINSSTDNQQTSFNTDNKSVTKKTIQADDQVNAEKNTSASGIDKTVGSTKTRSILKSTSKSYTASRIDNSINGNVGSQIQLQSIKVSANAKHFNKAINSAQKEVVHTIPASDKNAGNKAIENKSVSAPIAKDAIPYSHFIIPFSVSFAISTNRSNITPNTVAGFNKLKNLPRLSISLFASPQKAISHLKDEDDGMRRGSRDEFRSTEKNSTSYSTGILVDYPLKSNISIGTGVIYSSTVTDISPKIIIARQDDRGNIRYEFNCSAGYTYISGKTGNTPLIGDSARVLQSHTRISYVSVPVNIGYNVEAGKFIIKPTAGLLLSFLSHGNIESTISSSSMHELNSKDDISGLKPSYVSGSLNVTAIYKISKRIGIIVAPNSQFAITSINRNTGVKTYPVYLGVSGGLHVSF
jgi:hypothetical protein